MAKRGCKFQTITEESGGRRHLTYFKISWSRGCLIRNWGSLGTFRGCNRQNTVYVYQGVPCAPDKGWLNFQMETRMDFHIKGLSEQRKRRGGADIKYDHFTRPHISKMFTLNKTKWCLWFWRMWVSYLFPTYLHLLPLKQIHIYMFVDIKVASLVCQLLF